MSQRPQSGITQADGQSLARRMFGVGVRKETYANLGYLLVRFPLGIAYFTLLVTGLSLGFGLLPVVVGVPILAGVLGLGGYVGVIEAKLLAQFRGRDVSYNPVDPSELPVTDYLKTIATDPRNYLLVVFGLVSFIAGVHFFVGIIVVFSLGIVLAAAPLLYWVPGVEYGLTQAPATIELGTMSVPAGSVVGPGINTLPEALGASLLGIVVCLAGLHAVNLTAWLFSALTERLLVATPEYTGRRKP